jgi:predicted PurR-regulated permease PerM
MRVFQVPGFGVVRLLALLVTTAIGLYVCYLLILPFLPALVWALMAAVLAAPVHRAMASRLRHPNLSAAISVMLLFLVVFVPLALVAQHLGSTFQAGIATGQAQLASNTLQETIQRHPWFAWVDATFDRENVATILNNIGSWLTELATSFVRASVANVITLMLTFYLLFYFLRDHRQALRQARRLSPFTHSETSHLFHRAAETIRGVFYGTIITAAVQGALGGLMFWLVGLPNPLFWGVVMAMLSIIPVLGAFVIWIPAAAYLAMTGAWVQAAVVVAYGSIVIGGIDNVLHPALAGGRLRLHTVPVFISIVGGLILFGASGLIIGPLAMSMTIAILEIWRSRVRDVKSRPEDQWI